MQVSVNTGVSLCCRQVSLRVLGLTMTYRKQAFLNLSPSQAWYVCEDAEGVDTTPARLTLLAVLEPSHFSRAAFQASECVSHDRAAKSKTRVRLPDKPEGGPRRGVP